MISQPFGMAILRWFSVTAPLGQCGGPELLYNVTFSAGGGSPAGPAVAGITAQGLGLAVCSDQACPQETIDTCCLSAMPRDPRFSDYMYGVCFLP